MTDREQAVELAAQGLGVSEIGRRIGRPKQTVWHWLNTHACERCGRQGLDRRASMCRACYNDQRRERVREVERLWREGWTLSQIAERFDTTSNVIGGTIVRLRREGRDGLYRYKVENGKRVSA